MIKRYLKYRKRSEKWKISNKVLIFSSMLAAPFGGYPKPPSKKVILVV